MKATADLPPLAIAHALELVGGVRSRSRRDVAHTLRQAERTHGLRTLAVALAAMVDDSRTVHELLAWTTEGQRPDVMAWRRSLTDAECRDFHAAYARGEREPDVIDGNREWGARRARRDRSKAARKLRSVA